MREPVQSGEWGMSFFLGRQDDGGENWSEMGWTAFVGRSVYCSFYSDRHDWPILANHRMQWDRALGTLYAWKAKPAIRLLSEVSDVLVCRMIHG